MSGFPPVPAPTNGLHAALAAARRRRLRTAGLGSAVTAGALACLALLAGPGGSQVLLQEPEPQQPAAPSPSVTPVPAGRSGSAPVGAARSRGGPTSTDRRPPAADGFRPAGSGPLVGTAPGSRPTYRAGGVQRTDGVITTPVEPSCAYDGGTPRATGFCPSMNVPWKDPTTRTYRFDGYVCSSDPHATALDFATSNEIDFAVTSGATTLWRWSQWHPAALRPHTVPLATGYCTEWTFDWTGVDGNGRPLPAGDGYTLQVTFLAEQVRRHTIETGFSIS